MRTPFLRNFLNEISELNNYYHSFSFLWEQFKIESIKENIKAGDFTATTYKDNPESLRYNVKLSQLESASLNTKKFILKSLFLQSYFIYEQYLKEVYNFSRLGNVGLPEIDSSNSLVSQILENIAISNNLSIFDLDTLTYLRLRRNRLIHAGEKTGGEILTTINQKGRRLNRYWSKTLKKKCLYGLDFSKKEMLISDHKEYIDIFTIYRILAERIESIVFTKSLSEQDLKKAMIAYIMKNHSIDRNMLSRDRYLNKLVKTIDQEFNFNVTKSDIINLVEG